METRNENPFVCLFDLFIFRIYVLWSPNATRLFVCSASQNWIYLEWKAYVNSSIKSLIISSVFNERQKRLRFVIISR